MIKDDDSEIRFNHFDDEGILRSEIYFPDRKADNLKFKVINTEYLKPRNYNISELPPDNVIKLVKNSLLQNIIFTRIIQDSVLVDQLSPHWECRNIDELPLSIIPSYQEVLHGLDVIPLDWNSLTKRFWSMITAGNMKSGSLEYNGYQFFFVRRPKAAPIVINRQTHKTRYLPLEHHPPTPDVAKSNKLRPHKNIPIVFDPVTWSLLNDSYDKYYEIYLVAFQPEKNSIYFLAGNDICLHPDIRMYAPSDRTYLPFAKWPKPNQMELIQDKLIPLRAQNLNLDDVEENANKITGTVSIMSEGKRVTKKIFVDFETPYVIHFHQDIQVSIDDEHKTLIGPEYEGNNDDFIQLPTYSRTWPY